MPQKRIAIARAAREVFVREGYVRASVDTIAAEAGVSKRTIYNHYADKEELFLSVVKESSAAVATAFTEVAARHLGEITDLESDLVAFGRAWVSTSALFTDHGSLVLLMLSEGRHFPAILAAWKETGPQPVQDELAGHLRRIADRGLLDIKDERRAAGHFQALVTTPAANRSYFGSVPLTDADIDEIVTGGVWAFLRIYRPVGS